MFEGEEKKKKKKKTFPLSPAPLFTQEQASNKGTKHKSAEKKKKLQKMEKQDRIERCVV